MIELLDDAPAGVLALRASGLVTTEEYVAVVQPALRQWLQVADQLHVLAILDTDFAYDPHGDWRQATDGVEALPALRRLGVVTDAGWVRRLSPIAGFFVPGQVRAFPSSRLHHARAWVAA